MPALALTDRDGLYGAFKHVQACAAAGIKPLLGADLAVRPAGRVTLLTTGRRGWASLCRLVSAAHAAAQAPAHTGGPAAAHAGGRAPAHTGGPAAAHAGGRAPAHTGGVALAASRENTPAVT